MFHCGTDRLSPPQPADEERQSIIDQLKSEINAKGGTTFDRLTAVSYCTVIGEGTTYFVQVNTEGDKYLHVKIHKSYSNELSLEGVQLSKSLNDPIERF